MIWTDKDYRDADEAALKIMKRLQELYPTDDEWKSPIFTGASFQAGSDIELIQLFTSTAVVSKWP